MRIVIISCSNKKQVHLGTAPAIEMYDGPYYKTIRKLIRENNFPENTQIYIVSAKYGLLKLYDLIENYDLQMTKEIAEDMRTDLLYRLSKEIPENCNEIVINLGRDYLSAIDGIEMIIPEKCKLKYIEGTVIKRRKTLKEYLLNV